MVLFLMILMTKISKIIITRMDLLLSEFGLAIGFIQHLLIVTTSNYIHLTPTYYSSPLNYNKKILSLLTESVHSIHPVYISVRSARKTHLPTALLLLCAWLLRRLPSNYRCLQSHYCVVACDRYLAVAV
jgi:hypothetical protein